MTHKHEVNRPGGRTARRTSRRLIPATMLVALATAGLPALGATGAAAATPSAMPAAMPGAAVSNALEVVGHRAGKDWGPENTVSAIKHAIAVGADAVELDVTFTRSGRAVIFHDSTLDRTTNCTGTITSKTWKQIKDCDAGSWFHRAFAGEGIPTLGRALYVLGKSDARLYLHVKAVQGPNQARSIHTALKKAGMNNKRTIIFASSTPKLALLDRSGLRHQFIGRIFASADGWRAKHKWKTIIAYNTPITRALVNRAHDRGQKVLTVEGHPYSLDGIKGLGLDGFMADRLDATLEDLGRFAGETTKAATRSLTTAPEPLDPPVRSDLPQEDSSTTGLDGS